jgi:hypothetical protein
MRKILLALVGCALLAGAALADDLMTGVFTITEMGHGRFRATDQAGTEYLLHMGRGVTRLEPLDWIMNEGDRVYVEYWPTFRNRPTPTCTLIRLEERGAKSAALTNPLIARVEEMGRIGIRVRQSVGDQVITYQFFIGRGTRYMPAGWVPKSGDPVAIHFTTRPATFGWGQTLTANQIEKQ